MSEPMPQDIEAAKKAMSLRQFTDALIQHREQQSSFRTDTAAEMKKRYENKFFETLPAGIDSVDLGQGFTVTRPGLQAEPQNAPWTLEDINAYGARLDPQRWQPVVDPREQQE
jgi:hypothetical protein